MKPLVSERKNQIMRATSHKQWYGSQKKTECNRFVVHKSNQRGVDLGDSNQNLKQILYFFFKQLNKKKKEYRLKKSANSPRWN